jgi:hypothetical protein
LIEHLCRVSVPRAMVIAFASFFRTRNPIRGERGETPGPFELGIRRLLVSKHDTQAALQSPRKNVGMP